VTIKKHKEITDKILKSAIKVHKKLGPGFVEKIYQRALFIELKKSGLKFEREKKISIRYENVNLGYEQIDFIVENKVLVELKAVSEIQNIHLAQVISYLKAAKLQVGLILNFAKQRLEIKRVVL
jgi:GxxExxY protein